MKTFVRENSLSIFFAAIFAVTLTGQSFAGQHKYNAEQAEHGGGTASWWAYVTSPDYWGAVMENWQSEFLQFSLFIGATVWFVQKGSNESKRLPDAGRESDERQRVGRHADAKSPLWARAGGLKTGIYENSLLLAMVAIFFATWLAQSLNNWRLFNQDQREHSEEAVSWGRYLLDSDFWERTLQNWQSEFLAVGTMALFTIYLRQRGSLNRSLLVPRTAKQALRARCLIGSSHGPADGHDTAPERRNTLRAGGPPPPALQLLFSPLDRGAVERAHQRQHQRHDQEEEEELRERNASTDREEREDQHE